MRRVSFGTPQRRAQCRLCNNIIVPENQDVSMSMKFSMNGKPSKPWFCTKCTLKLADIIKDEFNETN